MTAPAAGLRSPAAASPFRSNLRTRFLTALVALPTVVGIFFVGPPLLGVALIGLLLLLGLVEFYALLEARGLAPLRKTGVALMALAFVEGLRPAGQGLGLLPLLLLLLLAVLLGRSDDLPRSVPSAAGTLLGALYLGGLGGSVAGLLVLEPVWQGPWRIGLLMAIVMGSDCMAYFVGHAVGRHRLAPTLSPGKTVEGALGGLAGGVCGALVLRAYGLPALDPWVAAGLGFVVAALGTLGDLLESLLKRWAGVKDSGTLFPGHGGVLDRLDSLLFGGPMLYYYFSLYPPI